VTIAANENSFDVIRGAGGILVENTSVNTRNTVIADNNIFGPTRTMRPTSNSPLVDNGIGGCETIDQRGFGFPAPLGARVTLARSNDERKRSTFNRVTVTAISYTQSN
jgi:hypothetical protein